MSVAIEKFVTRMSNILGPHDRAETPALLKELHVHLGKFNDEELQEAATILFASQKNKFWPTFGAMVVAAEEARRKIRVSRETRTPLGSVRRQDSVGEWYSPRSQSEDEAYWSRAAFDAADALVKSPMGKRAAKEGWISDLYDFCRDARRLPTEREQAVLIRKARKTDELLAASRPGTANNNLMTSAMSRRSALAEVANGNGSGWRWQIDNERRMATIAGRI